MVSHSFSELKSIKYKRQHSYIVKVILVLQSVFISKLRLFFAVLSVFLCLFFLMIHKHSSFENAWRQHLLSQLMPMLHYCNQPINKLSLYIQKFKESSTPSVLELELKIKEEALEAWRHRALLLERENTHLRALLKTVPQKTFSFVTARVLGAPFGAEHHVLIIDANTKYHKIKPLSVVVSAKGLIGHVLMEADRVLQVSLITGTHARTPVRFSKTGEQAILAGTGGAELEITHRHDELSVAKNIPQDKRHHLPIQIGDTLVTSGFGGLYPPDIPVAKISRIVPHKGGIKIYACLIENLTTLEFVRILEFKDESAPLSISK